MSVPTWDVSFVLASLILLRSKGWQPARLMYGTKENRR